MAADGIDTFNALAIRRAMLYGDGLAASQGIVRWGGSTRIAARLLSGKTHLAGSSMTQFLGAGYPASFCIWPKR